MAKFTKIEKRLLKNVEDDRLCESLASIRQAVEDIWASDAPHLIRDYTDHGIGHSERLVRSANRLLQANKGKTLSGKEAYLLLAGIYLHDIGMQCDIVKFPEIKEIAESLGAKFEVEFTAQTTSNYSIDEQKGIRNNHQYLSAAWISYAYKTGLTVLGRPAKTIPEELLVDLMDVCKYHAKLEMNDCPASFQFDSTERKRFVASLLRFADELDIDGQRVSIEVVKIFNLDPQNSIYWWLHNQTNVVFAARNLIEINVRLHPIDFEEHSVFIQDIFINEFRKKNEVVLEELAKDGIPVLISTDSKVLKYDLAEQLPPEIVQALRAMEKDYDQRNNQWKNLLLPLLEEIYLKFGSMAKTLSNCEKLCKQSKVVVRDLDKAELRAVSREWEMCMREFREIRSISSRVILERHWEHLAELSTQLETAADDVNESISKNQQIPTFISKYKKLLTVIMKELSKELQKLKGGNQLLREESADGYSK